MLARATAAIAADRSCLREVSRISDFGGQRDEPALPRNRRLSTTTTTRRPTLKRLRELLATPKRLATRPVWQASERTFVLSCPLMIEDEVIEGLELRATALLRRPQCEVMLGLVYEPSGVDRGMFERIDAWPIRVHRNPRTCDPDLQHLALLKIHGSHRHALENNAHLDSGELLDRLPVAEPLAQDPRDFEELVRLAYALWNIGCDILVPPPPWAPDLFLA